MRALVPVGWDDNNFTGTSTGTRTESFFCWWLQNDKDLTDSSRALAVGFRAIRTLARKNQDQYRFRVLGFLLGTAGLSARREAVLVKNLFVLVDHGRRFALGPFFHKGWLVFELLLVWRPVPVARLCS